MTDEEMAETWVAKYLGLSIKDLKAVSVKRLRMRIETLKEAFLAGLKAGSPKWHKVADGDLPKDENDVLVYSGEDWRMCVGKYFPKYKVWEAGCDAIAWGEIPKYTEE